MATAGLRMLNNGSAEAIMLEVRALLASTGFEYSGVVGARVLTGIEEGVWGWVAVNYATGALQVRFLRVVQVRHVAYPDNGQQHGAGWLSTALWKGCG